MCLILDPAFNILAQNSDHAKATLSETKNVIGRPLFEVFLDNPNNSAADGVSSVRQSLLNVLKTREADVMPERGPFEVRYWAIKNIPILGEDGYVQLILNWAEDATELATLRLAAAGATHV